uniref:hypothetical protein n=1 Tax=Herbidospora sakaeratensis TaxID=564415 RepID=UPI0007831ED8|nr:hypothetical protein [Herbidospora sakaeratensis]
MPAYEELRHLIDRLSPGQARRVLRLVQNELADPVIADRPQRQVSFIGIGEGDEDLSERVEEILAERFIRPV